MKITDCYVEDRRVTHGEYREPVPVMKVSEPIEELAVPIKYGERFRKIPCGPFVAVEYCPILGEFDDVDRDELSRFNTLGYHHEQLTPVIASHPDHPRLWLTMGVKRVRRLLRQHHDIYDIIVDETSAHNGRLNWRAELKEPTCFVLDCRVAPVATSWYGGAHVNHCAAHLEAFNRMLDQSRKSQPTTRKGA